ncbi:MAG: nucleotidyltransferase family protein [bacterium]
MRNLEEIMSILSYYKKELKIKYGVREIGIFGSYVRNEQGRASDIDILVEFEKTPSLLEFINLENYLSDILGVKVDLVMKDSLKPNIGRHILDEVILV